MIMNFSYNGMQSSICIHTRDRYNMTIRIQPFNVTLYSEYQFEVVYVLALNTFMHHKYRVYVYLYLYLRVFFLPKNDISLFLEDGNVDIIVYSRYWINSCIIYTYKESHLACPFFSIFVYFAKEFPRLYTSLWLSNIYKTIRESSVISYKYSGRKDLFFFVTARVISFFSLLIDNFLGQRQSTLGDETFLRSFLFNVLLFLSGV